MELGLVAWMFIVTMMGAGIGRNSNTLELRGAPRIYVHNSCTRMCVYIYIHMHERIIIKIQKAYATWAQDWAHVWYV